MELSNSAFDLASMREEQEREAAVDAARALLKARGSADCKECGRALPLPRRRAAPFAVRCIECQTIHEQEKYHR